MELEKRNIQTYKVIGQFSLINPYYRRCRLKIWKIWNGHKHVLRIEIAHRNAFAVDLTLGEAVQLQRILAEYIEANLLHQQAMEEDRKRQQAHVEEYLARMEQEDVAEAS